jgi:asparagine synthase (glutamine-hydrolysing)
MFGAYALTFGRGRRRHALHERARMLGLPTIDRPELLMVTSPDAHFLQSNRSVLFGQLFTDRNVRLRDYPPCGECDGPVELKKAFMPYWGNFALFSAGPGTSTVYRDPSGSVPVYCCGGGKDAVFVSDAAIARQLGLLDTARVDQAFAIHWLQFPFLRTCRTGLEQVSEVLPGMAWTSGRAGTWEQAVWWSPAPFARKRVALFDSHIAAARLRDIADQVIPAQLPTAAGLLQLSGGLDSSIIAACLSAAGVGPPCINFATRSKDGDERRFARDVAERLHLSLLEIGEAAPHAIPAPRCPSFQPTTNPLLAPVEQAIGEAAETLGLMLLIDGGGGDNLFSSLTTASPVVDALRWAGPRAAANAISDIALRAGCTWWDVVRAAARRARRRSAEWPEDRSFLSSAVVGSRPEPHPWLDGLRRVPPGKREHVEALVHIQHFLDRSATGMPRLHPLVAQPLLEHCLRVPSWLWVQGGRDRAVARNAFARRLPESVLSRHSKGSLQGLFQRAFARLRPQILEILMTGTLRKQGIIDAADVETCLRRGEWHRDDVQMRISELVALDLWLQSLA